MPLESESVTIERLRTTQAIAMNAKLPHLITVDIAPHETGWFKATSQDCPGLLLYESSRDRVLDLIAEGIEVLYLARDHIQVKALRLTRPEGAAGEPDSHIPFAVIPADAGRLGQTA